jgi:4-amino-4-deoxy-L-arabinose transferase-like glycosyltransferase
MRRYAALLVVILALILRLLFVLVIEPHFKLSGGDTNWYMITGYDLVSTGKTIHPLQPAPLYMVFIGTVQVIVPGHGDLEFQIIRLIQCLTGALLCWFVYDLARRWVSERAGLLAATVLAISPTMIIEAGSVLTESLFLFFMLAGLVLYARSERRPRHLILVGIVFGLVTLTRAVFLLFPFLIAGHLLITNRKQWLRPTLALLVSYILVISTWTVYNEIVWHRFIIGGEGFLSFLYQGAEGSGSPSEVDIIGLGLKPGDSSEQRHEAMREEVNQSVIHNPIGWMGRRVKELASALIQPHNTVHYDGESIKSATSRWIHEDRTLSGLLDITKIEFFWPKLLLYIFHFAGLLLGSIGMIVSWRRWKTTLPLYLVIGYFIGIHLVLLALPRYLFPTYPIFWIFAAALWRGDRAGQEQHEHLASPA